MKILVTGIAGFIGMHTAQRLLARGDEVIGVDNLNDYYDVALKRARLEQLRSHARFRFEKLDLADTTATAALFARERCPRVVHLAAQAGVRYSLKNPQAYAQSNLAGFLNILEGCRHHGVEHLVFASSSSVYGANTALPYSTHAGADHPVSLYAATKKANELMAHAYSHLYRLPATGLRFFTVYGPWGRPDMAYAIFTKAILDGQTIDVFNHGRMKRDFTYIDDVVEGVVRVLDKVPAAAPAFDPARPDPASSHAPYRLYNIGNHTPVALGVFIATLERLLQRTAKKNLLPMQPGDVLETCADVADLQRDVGFAPSTPLDTGLARYVEWYRAYHRIPAAV
ncbi:MAG: NAD-dependent epimerase [Burkholderiales bacterium]